MPFPEIVQLLSTFGFPTVAAIVMWKVLEKRTAKSEEQCAKVQEAQQGEILFLRSKLNDLEAYVREQLTQVVTDKASAVTACTAVLSEVHAYLKAHP